MCCLAGSLHKRLSSTPEALPPFKYLHCPELPDAELRSYLWMSHAASCQDAPAGLHTTTHQLAQILHVFGQGAPGVSTPHRPFSIRPCEGGRSVKPPPPSSFPASPSSPFLFRLFVSFSFPVVVPPVLWASSGLRPGLLAGCLRLFRRSEGRSRWIMVCRDKCTWAAWPAIRMVWTPLTSTRLRLTASTTATIPQVCAPSVSGQL